MRELRVEDALLYLDQVKIEFGDRPHVYNEFLDIMKHFKAQMIDTPGVIQRVSNLFSGNRTLVLGFNTFLPDGYKIELDADGNTVASQVGVPGTVTLATASGAPVPQPQSQMGGLGSLSNGQQQQQQGQPQSMRPISQQQAPLMVNHEQRPNSLVLGPTENAVPTPRREGPTGFRPLPQGTSLVSTSNSNNLIKSVDPTQHLLQQQQQQPQQQPKLPAPPNPPPQQQTAQPVEFDHAINYVTTIKKRFASHPQIYKSFLEILHTYQKEQRGIEQVLEDVSDLFGEHPDLLREFCYFLPDGVQQQARKQLEAVVIARQKQAAAAAVAASTSVTKQKSRSQTKPRMQTPPVPIPFGASQGRSEAREREIQRMAKHGTVSFAPRRPPRRGELKAKDLSSRGRPKSIPQGKEALTVFESSWLENAKKHLTRKELASPSGIFSGQDKKHTPWTEFCKCLHLFASGILNNEELIMLLEGLFKQGHAPKSGVNAGGGAVYSYVAEDGKLLMEEFQSLLLGRGPYADQIKRSNEKGKYGHTRLSNIDFKGKGCQNPTPNYYSLPKDYPQPSCSEETENDKEVLNSMLFQPVNSTMESDYLRSSQAYSVYVEEMFKLEDERFEVDMAINRNHMAINELEPIDQEVRELKEIEEKEGQPFGRLNYKLKHDALSQNTINAIARIYTSASPSDNYDNEILYHLNTNALTVIPIIFERLKQKNIEWRRVKSALVGRWQGVCSVYYQGLSDVLCSERRGIVIDYFDSVVNECCNVNAEYSVPTALSSFAASAIEKDNLDVNIFDPHLELALDVSQKVHEDVLSLLIAKKSSGSKAFWVDIVAPFFGISAQRFKSKFDCSAKSKPKYNVDQVVSTSYGTGSIVAVLQESPSIRYQVDLPFGQSYVNESSIKNCTSTNKDESEMSSIKMESKEILDQSESLSSVIFGTEYFYVFIRLYSSIVKILSIFHCKNPIIDSNGGNGKANFPTCSGKSYGHNVQNYEEFMKYFISFLKKMGKKKMSVINRTDLENKCRAFGKDKTYLISSLPILLGKCSHAISKLEGEQSTILSLMNCSLSGPIDLSGMRTRALEISNKAIYRIQMKKGVTTTLYFSHHPTSADFKTAPLKPHVQDIEPKVDDNDEEMSKKEMPQAPLLPSERIIGSDTYIDIRRDAKRQRV